MSKTKEKKGGHPPIARHPAAPHTPPPPPPSLDMRAPKDICSLVVEASIKKTRRSALALFLVGLFAGLIIGVASVATSSLSYSVENAGVARMMNALLFPFGLCIIVLLGGELYTGNSLMTIAYMEKKITLKGIMYNWFWVYLGNFVGAVFLAYSFMNTYHLNGGGGNLAVSMMRVAVTKTTISWMDAFVLAIWCNMLVCIAVMIATGARDAVSKAIGGIMPVSLFVMAGFEHCVANMCYIPLGIIASKDAELAKMAVEAGLDLSSLTVGNFLMGNIVPVTLGNTVGGVAIALFMWYVNLGQGGEYRDRLGNS